MLLVWALALVVPASCSRPWTFAPGEMTAGSGLLALSGAGPPGSPDLPLIDHRRSDARPDAPPVGSAAVVRPPPRDALAMPHGRDAAGAPGRFGPGSLPSPTASVFGSPGEPAVWLAQGANWDSPPAVVPSVETALLQPLESPSRATALPEEGLLGLDASPGGSATEAVMGDLPMREPATAESAMAESVGGELRAKLRRAGRDVWLDHRHYYCWTTAGDLALGVALAAPVANTSLDEQFQNWYQDDVRGAGLDAYARYWKPWGEGQIFIPAFAGLAVACNALSERPIVGQALFGAAGDYSWRVTRGYLVGAPPMLLMQALLGGSRPGEAGVGSQWKPFDDTNAVSGHAFMGAVPWITAARMTDRPLLKCGFYVLSTHTAWSRLNDDDHYLTQICLGWWMAYLACRAVDETAVEESSVAVRPVATREFSGFALIWRR